MVEAMVEAKAPAADWAEEDWAAAGAAGSRLAACGREMETVRETQWETVRETQWETRWERR